MSERARRHAILLLVAAAIGVVRAARSQRASAPVAVAPPLSRPHTAASTPDTGQLPRIVDVIARVRSVSTVAEATSRCFPD
jgi:hypothetical protein